MNRRNFTALVILTTSVSAIACAQVLPPSALVASLTSPNSNASIELTISVAASVQDAMKEVQVAYQAAAPQVTITYNFGSSGSLAQQITQGAPVDVFLSASPMWMDDLESKGEIMAGSRQNLLQNAMTLVVPENASAVASFQDLPTDRARKIAIGEPESVPAGQYAKEVLATLDIFAAIQPKLVFAKDVRQVLAYVETGNVDAGLVYATDVQMSDRVQAIAIAPATSHAPIIYPIAVVQESDELEAAQAFVEFLASEPATAIFQGYGFGMAE